LICIISGFAADWLCCGHDRRSKDARHGPAPEGGGAGGDGRAAGAAAGAGQIRVKVAACGGLPYRWAMKSYTLESGSKTADLYG
jgi:hypothetical protein